MTYNDYCDAAIEQHIGMNGQWIPLGYNNVYWSTARDMARFGLLILNEGVWDEKVVLDDKSYIEAMTSPSQDLNPSYGYLWWLNGQSKIIPPSIPTAFNLSLAGNAPSDLFAAMGKNGQFVDIVPSEDLVVIRMGEAPDGSLVPITFHDEMWKRIGEVLE